MINSIPEYVLAPFAIMLLCIAIIPLTKLGHWWENNLHKLYMSLILGVPVAIWMAANGFGINIEHQMLYEYIPFILLLTSLFVVTGGICIKGDLRATPTTNTIILATGFVLASFMGTTGAAMLLVRLLLATISQRKHKAHTVMFFIAIVANCGGILSPLGDPPLFLLFQAGAPFGWFMHLAPEWAFTGILLLIIYFITDTYYYRKEPQENIQRDNTEIKKITATGLINIVWLLGIIAATMFINSTYIPQMGNPDAPWYLKLLREWVFIAIICLSLLTTKKATREANQYSWAPILEVAVLFIGIFATMTPALIYLGQQSFSFTAPASFMYCTGALSSFLDNAPTAMVFHAMAGSLNPADVAATLQANGGDAIIGGIKYVAGVQEILLKAIALGAVFFGAMTYIGNGPNFMVKAIAEEDGIKMPSFFGYILKFSLIVLLPVYIIVQLIFL